MFFHIALFLGRHLRIVHIVIEFFLLQFSPVFRGLKYISAFLFIYYLVGTQNSHARLAIPLT